MEFSFEEAKSIISDKSNPNYSKYHSFDKDIHGAVTRAYVRQFPGEYDTSDNTPAALRTPPEKKSEGPGELGAEVQGGDADNALVDALRQDREFGADYDTNMEVARKMHRELFGERAEEIAEQIDATLSESEKVLAIKILSKLARR